MAMHYTGALLGRRARITFPNSVAECRYTANGKLIWTVTDNDGNATNGAERVSYVQMSDTLHFLNWQEKTGFSVSQVIDTEKQTVRAFWSYVDSVSGRTRASMFVDGRFEFA